MSEKTTIELVNEAYEKGFKAGISVFRKENAESLKVRYAGFFWKMQQVFIRDSEKLCECENKQVVEDFQEMMFSRILLPADDLYLTNSLDGKPVRAEIL